jgi:sulfite oxidase
MPARITADRPAWSWAFWEATVALARGRHVLVARATDQAGATQPATVRETWNVKGYNNNAWHRIAVRAE